MRIIFRKPAQGCEKLVRGEREFERRGGKGIDRHGARGSKDSRPNLPGPEDDPYRGLRDSDYDQHDSVNDDYIWPVMEQDEDD